MSAVYDSNAAKVIGIRGASAYGLAVPITSDGSSFTIGSSTTITTNAYGTMAASVFDSNEKKVILYQDGGDTDKEKHKFIMSCSQHHLRKLHWHVWWCGFSNRVGYFCGVRN